MFKECLRETEITVTVFGPSTWNKKEMVLQINLLNMR